MRERTVTSVLTILTLVIGIAGCGGKEKPEKAAEPRASVQPGADEAAPAPADTARDAPRSANAVTTGKAGAALDLQYELTPRPEIGQPFTIQLAFVPRVRADSIDVQLSATPGLRITSAENVRFEGVHPGERYTTEVLVVGDAPGLYYVGVVARMATQVQADARTFSVPVVVGSPPAAEKPAPEVDASGNPVKSVPATESGEP